MNLIWILLILASLAYGLLTGSVSSVNQVIVNVGRETLELALPLVAATLPPTLRSMYSDWARRRRPAALRRWSACSGTIRIRKPPAAQWLRF